MSEAVGETVTADTTDRGRATLAEKHDVEIQPGWGAGDIALEMYEKLVEHTLLSPTFVRDYPDDVQAAGEGTSSDPGVVEAFDLVINGVELAAAYSEMNDPVIQRERLVEQSLQAAAAIRRRWTWTRTSFERWSSGCPRRVGWVWAWTGC